MRSILFLLFCAVSGLAIPIFFNPLNGNSHLVNLDLNQNGNNNNNNKPTSEKPSTVEGTNSNARPIDNGNENGNTDPDIRPSELPNNPSTTGKPSETQTRTNGSSDPSINPSTTPNPFPNYSVAVIRCDSKYDAVNFRIAPIIDHSSRDSYGNDSLVLAAIPCNAEILLNRSRSVSNSDGSWYSAIYKDQKGWVTSRAVE